jgi:hypothetical protein
LQCERGRASDEQQSREDRRDRQTRDRDQEHERNGDAGAEVYAQKAPAPVGLPPARTQHRDVARRRGRGMPMLA